MIGSIIIAVLGYGLDAMLILISADAFIGVCRGKFQTWNEVGNMLAFGLLLWVAAFFVGIITHWASGF